MHFHFPARKLISYLLTCAFISLSLGQSGNKYSAINWQLEDLTTDSVYGTSVTKAYNELLKGKTRHPVIVAVIDGGIDTAHEDLQGRIWTNKKEIPGNGIDDDKNGYIDDVHGWNFLGGKDGRNIEHESLEVTREYYRLSKKYGLRADSALPAKGDDDLTEWLKLKEQHYNDSARATMIVERLTPVVAFVGKADSAWKSKLHKDTVTVTDIKLQLAKDSSAADSLTSSVIDFFSRQQIPEDVPLSEIVSEAGAFLAQQQSKLSPANIDPNAARLDIVKDNPDDINDKNYGNNNVDAGTPSHGTHVAGIIAAVRNNNLGMNGVADSVLIMAVRAVPDGDERDKDIALAIRYAVDNGARIISMSFGKAYSPGKQWVDDAVKYAEKKDVLLVHAAGNEGDDLDTIKSYPSAEFLHDTVQARNYMTIGASSGGPDSVLAASFSNYGKKEVDLFAPGLNIYSSIPGSKYASYSGTSMATPVVSGIAALILEFYPKLTAEQVKYVLEQSVTPLPDDMVKVPHGDEMVKFGTLSKTGGIVNAYNAIKLAGTIKGKRKK